MSKYTFEKIGSARFEHLVQALLEKHCRTDGPLIQFGDGKDGGREATWSQPSTDQRYARPANESSDVDKEWVFQAKYHDIGLRGWDRARADVESDLNKELDRLVNKYDVPVHKYILITNVPFSGVRHVGTRDKVNVVIAKWRPEVPEIEVWDATDLSRMLDADPGTRTTFLGEVLPGDILRELLANQLLATQSRTSSYRTYLKSLLRSESEARAEEAGDEGGLKLEKVFVDLDLALNQESANDCAMPLVEQVDKQKIHRHEGQLDTVETHIPKSLDRVPASFALLRANYKSLLIKGGPGVGKSTLTQFLTLYHASRIVDPPLSKRLAGRLKLSGGLTSESLDSHCEVRFPLRIELRRYAKWVGETLETHANPHFAAYFAECINKEASSSLDMDDIFALAAQNPVLLLLDGLDEVPQPSIREIIFKELRVFIDRCECEDCDVNVVLSSRPQGYRGEFDGFEPLEWRVVDLARNDFDDYSNRWLAERIANKEEQEDARRRVAHGMESYAVQLMAKTLLQATVMLTIAKRKHAIPHARHKLYEKFVEVVFEREQNKQPIIRDKAEELKRLHERVGFELICKLEKQVGVQTLKGAEFRSCVERVILDYRPGSGVGVSVNSVVEEILVLAKDRLCLLAGKGDHQEDIDFVIQPFREYFAASYLARHEDAEPDRAYNALVARQHIWANVLQFYAAFQRPAQQKNWISEADGSDELGGDIERLIEMTRRRRALVRVLPEFEHPKNEYVRRAFNNLMEISTRWTWRDVNSTSELLDAFAQNGAFYYLEGCFGTMSTDDERSLFVELDLLSKTAGPSNIERVQSLFSKLIANERTVTTALQVASGNAVPVNVASVDRSIIEENLRSTYFATLHRNREFRFDCLEGLSDGQVIDFIVSGALRNHQVESMMAPWINELLGALWGERYVSEIQGIGVAFPVYFFERRLTSSAISIREKLASTVSCLSSSYLIALLDAIQEPTDVSLYNVAVDEEASLRSVSQVDPRFQVHHILGPAQSSFKSREKWIEARNAVFDSRSEELGEWIARLEEDTWLILFFPQAVWSYLDPTVNLSKLRELEGGVLDRLILIASGSPIATPEYFGHRDCRFDSALICKSLVTVASKIGTEFLADSELVTVLYHMDFQTTNEFDGNEILAKVVDIAWPPRFALWVVSMTVRSVGVDMARLVEFWRAQCTSDFIWMRNANEEVLKSLLALKSHDALRLAVSLRDPERRRAVSDTVVQIAKEYCGLLIGSNELTGQDIRRLLGLPAQVEEIEIWWREDAIEALQENAWGLAIFRERLFDIINCANARHHRIREVLCGIVQKRDNYAIELGLAAIDAIHRLEELTSGPLADEDWQISRA